MPAADGVQYRGAFERRSGFSRAEMSVMYVHTWEGRTYGAQETEVPMCRESHTEDGVFNSRYPTFRYTGAYSPSLWFLLYTMPSLNLCTTVTAISGCNRDNDWAESGRRTSADRCAICTDSVALDGSNEGATARFGGYREQHTSGAACPGYDTTLLYI